MKKLFLLVLIAVSVFAGEFKNSNLLELESTKYDYKLNGKEIEDDSVQSQRLLSYFKYDAGDYRISGEIETTNTNQELYQLKNRNQSLFINALMYEQKLNDSYSLTTGVIPFTNTDDFFFDKSFIEENGNPMDINLVLQSMFLTYKYKVGDFDAKLKVGYGWNNQIKFPSRQYQLEENDGSHGIFIINDYSDGMNNFQIDLYSVNVKYIDQDAGKLDIASLLYRTNEPFFDSDVFVSVGFSKYKQTSSNIKNVLIAKKGINPLAVRFYPQLFDFGNDTKTGNHIALGIRKQFTGDFSTSFEAMKLSKNWVSLISQSNLDNPGFYENRGGINYIFKANYSITKSIGLEVSHTIINREWSSRVGAVINPVKSGTVPGLVNDYTRKDLTTIKASYIF